MEELEDGNEIKYPESIVQLEVDVVEVWKVEVGFFPGNENGLEKKNKGIWKNCQIA